MFQSLTILLLLTLYLCYPAHAQFEKAKEKPPTTPTDTTIKDTIPPQKVKPLVLSLSMLHLIKGEPFIDTLKQTLNGCHFWDETDTLSGFTQSLGQVGKPYLNYLNGLQHRYLNTNLFQDPVSQYVDIYLLNPLTQILIFDTRTPYTNLQFDQADYETQLLRVTASINPSPFSNVTALYRRRTAKGAYLNNTTDHYNIALSNTYFSFERRLIVSLSVSFNQLNDELNGGTYQDGLIPYNQSFNKLSQRLNFNNVTLFRKSRTLSAIGAYSIIKDSVNELVALANMQYLEYNRNYSDGNLEDTAIRYNRSPFHPYGTIYDTAATSMNEYFLVISRQVQTGLRYQFNLNKFKIGLQGNYTFIAHTSDGTVSLYQEKHQQHLSGYSLFNIKGTDFQPRIDLSYSQNNLLKNEYRLEIRCPILFNKKQIELTDSILPDDSSTTWKPVSYPIVYYPRQAHISFLNASQNPTLQQLFWRGNTFIGNPLLTNENIFLLKTQFKYTDKPRIRKANPFLQNYFSFTLYYSQISSPIYYNADAQVFQDLPSDYYGYLGLLFNFRVRASRFYLELNTIMQLPTGSDFLSRYNFNQPLTQNFHLYYLNKILNKKTTLQVGFYGYYYENSNTPFQLEPSLLIPYPQQNNYYFPAYFRSDFYVSAHIKSALVYFKIIHWNEGFIAPGYYTTPFYPMLERTFSFGVNWNFWD